MSACVPSTADDTTGNPYVPLSVVKAEPAAGLAPPSAVIIREVSGERFMNITGPEAAFYGHVFGVPATSEETRAFFDRELRKLGWVPDLGPILSSGEADGWGWCKPRIYYRLAVFDARSYDRVGIVGGEQYRSVVDGRLQGTTSACPHTPRPFPTPLPSVP